MKVYLFHRLHNGQPFFYPTEYKNDEDAAQGAMHNPGTIKITTLSGRIVWPKPEHKQ